MIAGKLTELIDVYSPIDEIDGFGASTPTEWQHEGRWRCERVKLTGRTIVEAAELYPDYRAELVIAWAHRPQEGWRVDLDGITYLITAIIPNRQRGIRTLTIDRLNS